jgi:FMN phosphatase YigB (HAD superfamily)
MYGARGMTRALLITDLDNTLYDWVTFFTTSFRGMVEELCKLTHVPEKRILSEFREVHQRYGNSEQPFAILELDVLRQKFPGASRAELAREVDLALHRFNRLRKETLKLYPDVAQTLIDLKKHGVTIVGHTEAIVANAYWRLAKLKIESYFGRLYALEGKQSIHQGEMIRQIDPPPGFVRIVPQEERKPNPALIADICKREGVDISSTFYVGDSIVRDMAMSRNAGAVAIWAQYGTRYDPSHWEYLVKVTHWTDEDVRREKDLRAKYADVRPDHVIDSFSAIRGIILG